MSFLYNSYKIIILYNSYKREDEVNKDYMAEIQNGPTISFKPISYEISNKYEEISAIVQEIQGDLTRIRNQFKEQMV